MGFANTTIHHAPIYPVVDAARYLRIPSGTLQAWLRGRTYQTKDGQQFSKPLIQRPSPDFSQLSFTNLVEAHVLRVSVSLTYLIPLLELSFKPMESIYL